MSSMCVIIVGGSRHLRKLSVSNKGDLETQNNDVRVYIYVFFVPLHLRLVGLLWYRTSPISLHGSYKARNCRCEANPSASLPVGSSRGGKDTLVRLDERCYLR